MQISFHFSPPLPVWKEKYKSYNKSPSVAGPLSMEIFSPTTLSLIMINTGIHCVNLEREVALCVTSSLFKKGRISTFTFTFNPERETFKQRVQKVTF